MAQLHTSEHTSFYPQIHLKTQEDIKEDNIETKQESQMHQEIMQQLQVGKHEIQIYDNLLQAHLRQIEYPLDIQQLDRSSTDLLKEGIKYQESTPQSQNNLEDISIEQVDSYSLDELDELYEQQLQRLQRNELYYKQNMNKQYPNSIDEHSGFSQPSEKKLYYKDNNYEQLNNSSHGHHKTSLQYSENENEISSNNQIGESMQSKYRRRKKNRKIRTTITRQKLSQMNQIFSQYMKQKEQGKNPRYNLKQIGNQLSLGYSTILHKYRQFRSAKIVKGGALIASLQKKRKYKKSLRIESIIEQSLTEKAFYTAVQLSQFIRAKYQLKFSRSIISRHLGQMGYSYKNLKISPIEKNKPKYKETRRIYSLLIQPIIIQNPILIYIDEFALSISAFLKKKSILSMDRYGQSEKDYVSVIAAASTQGVLYHNVKFGYYTRQQFCETIERSVTKAKQLRSQNGTYRFNDSSVISYLVTDMNKIHLDGQNQQKIISQTLSECGIHRLFLPPASPQLNPLDSIFTNLKHRLHKKQIKQISDLRQMMIKNMQQIACQSTEVYFKDVLINLQKSKNEQNL